MKKIKGYIENFRFQNNENHYCVFDLICENEDVDETVCNGILWGAEKGDVVELEGDFSEHPVYGPQFKFVRYAVCEQRDSVSVERYLSSGAVKGVGPALAMRIVGKFGEDTLRIMEEEPERLAEIKGISDKKAREIAVCVSEKKDVRDAMIYLQQYGISNALSVKIFDKYGIALYSVLRENPYRLAEDIHGIGFRTADEIARKMGVMVDADYRIRCGILHVLMEATSEGHLYLPETELVTRATELLGVVSDVIEVQFSNLMLEGKIVIKCEETNHHVYAASLYYEELRCASSLKECYEAFVDFHVSPEEEERITTKIRSIEQEEDIILNELQREAILSSVKNGISIVTGGPGTGKTTIIKILIRYFILSGMDVVLAAPTGRAAKRMAEATGYEAKTIHRLLELSGTVSENDDHARFARNEENPLEADLIIIDEMSMVDTHLFAALLRAIVPGTRLLLTGDCNQLPSVGPGNVLKDLIDCQKFRVVKLETIYRQAAQSDIIVNAHKIKDGEEIAFHNQSKDFFFLERERLQVIYRDMVLLVRDKLPKYVHASATEVQVLTPMRKGPLGVETLNKILQEQLNPPAHDKKEYERREGVFRVGDKVMQVKNNYNTEWEIQSKYGIAIDSGKGVFNGDIGKIAAINTYVKEITVLFDDNRSVNYPFQNLDELELAYAVTIHKSQGSEYPAIVIPILDGPDLLMNRNLLYTAVTRGAECVVIMGSKERVSRMIHHAGERRRYTGLCKRMEEVFGKE